MKLTTIAALLGTGVGVLGTHVTVLTKDTMNSFAHEHEIALIEYVKAGCDPCEALEPEFEEAAARLSSKNIRLAKVDCTAEEGLCKDAGVEGYPTMKVHHNSQIIARYEGPHDAQSITRYMIKRSLAPVATIDSNSLDEFKELYDVVVVAFLDAHDNASNESYTEVASKLKLQSTHIWAATSDLALAKAEGVEQPAIVVYKSFDEGKATFSGKLEDLTIQKFVNVAATPLVGEIGPKSYTHYIALGVPLAYLFAETQEERDTFAKELQPLAERYKGRVNFVTMDATAYGHHGETLDLEVGKWPAFAIHDTVKNRRFPFDQSKDLTVEGLTDFVNGVVTGTVIPKIKSEPIPLDKQEGAVTVVVEKTYDEIVVNNDKDVLLEYYAPWCGYCKAFGPAYETLAELYANQSDIIIAKVDATANDVPHIVEIYPTIRLFPAGKKGGPVAFEGRRAVERLVEFIKDKGSYGIAATVPEGLRENDVEYETVTDSVRASSESAKVYMESEEDESTAEAEKRVEDAGVHHEL